MYCLLFVLVDPMTGQLSRNATITLDYEEEQTYTLTIVAEDDGDAPLSSEATVTIDIMVRKDWNQNV